MKPPPLIRRLWPILYEDDDLLAVSKPWGIDTGALSGTRSEGVVEMLTKLRGNSETLIPANRLSRYESGVLLLVKHPPLATHIRSGLRSGKITQEFVAVVLGRMTTKQITIGTKHGASKGSRADARRRRATSLKPDSSIAPTTVLALQHGTKRTLVSIRTVAPTTHALKAQLRAVRLRTLGDPQKNRSDRPVTHQMMCLHLSRIAFHHPGIKRKLTIEAPPPGVFRSIVDGERDVTRGLFAALARRTPLLEDKSIEFCRLLTGAAEDVPGLIVDKCGGVVVIDVQINRSPATVDVRDVARWYSDTIHAETVIVRCNVKKDQEPGPGNGASGSRYKEDHVLGRPCPESITVRERGLKFIVRPNQGRSIGLYADHRDNRARVRAMAREKDVLNLFAYTCGFSLAAAVGGAASTVSVDLAGRHLEWGRDNFALNHVDTEHHEFLQADSFEYLRRAARQDRLFDLIIIDPPSFAHGRRRGRDFSVSRDLGPLVTGALTVLKPGGVMMVSTNLRGLSLSGLRQRVRTAAQGHRIRAIDTPPLPTDFAADPDHAKTLFVAFS